MVPCGVSFPSFFPLVERKRVAEGGTRSQHGRESVSVSVKDNPSVIACGADSSPYTGEPLGAAVCGNPTHLADRTYALTRPRRTKGFNKHHSLHVGMFLAIDHKRCYNI